VAEDEDDLGSENSDAVFEARDNLGRDHIAGDARYEDASDGMVEHDLDAHARVGAGENGGEGFLLVYSMVAQNLEVLVEARSVASVIFCSDVTRELFTMSC
jgi:hypothetical protein